MTPLEHQTFSSRFKICLLGVRTDRNSATVEYCGTLFEEGVRQCAVHHQINRNTPDDVAISEFRKLLTRVVGAPNVLAVFGNGWRDLIAQILPDYVVAELRILDLTKTAISLKPALPGHASADDIRRAYGIQTAPDADSLDSPLFESILWALIGYAGQLGMDWPQFLAVAQKQRNAPTFEKYAFDMNGLASLPDAPGVYIMYDLQGAPLYVGKAASLARRLSDYFRTSQQLPAKLSEIRDRIYRFEYRLVGSEIEALLLENRLIAEFRPDVNVQLQIAEGTSRYGVPHVPLALICPSVRKGYVELFFCGDMPHALQFSLNPNRPSEAKLARILQAVLDPSRKVPASGKSLTDWGVEGSEICVRYFARFKSKLQWMELSAAKGVPALVSAILEVVRVVSTHAPDPGEFRSGH